jgi:hypothetical protein
VVHAYAEALWYDDSADIAVTWFYLVKAKAKIEKLRTSKKRESIRALKP